MKLLLVILLLLQTTQIQAKQWKWKSNNMLEKAQSRIIKEEKKTEITNSEETPHQAVVTDKSISKQDFIIEKNNENLFFHEDGFANIDTNGDKLISEEEYLFYFIGYEVQSQKDVIKEAFLKKFNKLDINKDNFLDKKEFFHNQMNQETANMQKIFDFLDDDKSGNLSSMENDINIDELNKITKELEILNEIYLDENN